MWNWSLAFSTTMASFQFFGKAVLKALRWKPRTPSTEETDSPPGPTQQDPEITAGSEITDVSPPEVHTAGLQVWLGGASEAGNETSTEGNTSRTSTPTAELTQPGALSETPEKKSSSLRRRKFGVFMRPGSAKSFDADVANAKRDSKKGRKKFLSHVRTLSMGHYHSTPRPDADTTLQSTPTKSAPHLHLGHQDSATESSPLCASVTEINVIDVDGDAEVFDDEVWITFIRLCDSCIEKWYESGSNTKSGMYFCSLTGIKY